MNILIKLKKFEVCIKGNNFLIKKRYKGAMIQIFSTKIRYGIVVFVIGTCCTFWHYVSPEILKNLNIQSVFFAFLNFFILLPLVYLGHLGGIIVHEEVD